MKKLSLFILFLAAIQLFAQGTLSGIVISPYGDAEHKVSVELFTNSGDRFDDKIETMVVKTLTDEEGYYRIEGIVPGKYDVRFNENKADSTCVTITVANVKIAGGDESLHMRLEPRCSAFGPLLCIREKGAYSPKIRVQLKTHAEYKVIRRLNLRLLRAGKKVIVIPTTTPLSRNTSLPVRVGCGFEFTSTCAIICGNW